MVKKNDNLVSSDSDGGYYAIKGFLFQFDKTLMTILQNPDTTIEVEQTQDVGVNKVYTQIKHKETQDYAPSKVKKAVKQLLSEYKLDTQSNYSLYCYFKNRQPEELTLDDKELNKILGDDAVSYSPGIKAGFLKNFTLVFANDFESQLDNLLSKIKDVFSLKDTSEALVYYALMRSKIMNLAIIKERAKRAVTLNSLRAMVGENEKVIFDLSYSKFLGNEEYLSFIKKEYFVFKGGVNIPNKERLLAIGLDATVTDAEVIEIIQKIQKRFYSRDNSPAPYIHLHDVDENRLHTIKQQLWGKKLYFADGTHFHGDKFRLEDLVESTHDIKANVIKFKLIGAQNLEDVTKSVRFDEVFAFLNAKSSALLELSNIAKTFYIEKTTNILKVL